MPLRTHVPAPLHDLARSIYLRLGHATSALRATPDFLVIGGQRCGTTSLFKHLAEHPQALRPGVEKGVDYFTLHYDKDLDWYRGHFPLDRLARLRRAGHGGPVIFEACTYYLFHPLALERIAKDLPDVKLVAMLRDPVERAYSAYKHEFARDFESEPDFERALALEDERLEGELEKIAADPAYESIPHRHHAYRRRGQYAEQLERAFDLFPRDRIHVLDSESFFADPAMEYAAVTDFLGLRRFTPARFDQHNARPSGSMPAGARAFLTEYYASWDDRLADLLGRQPAWRR
jgi:hypothetical protein